MKSILETLRTGNAKERLAVISDITSILGISIATVIGGSLALGTRLDVPNIIGTIVISLLCLAGALVVVLSFIATSDWLKKKLSTNPTYRAMLQIALWSVFLALLLLSAFFAYEILSSVKFVR